MLLYFCIIISVYLKFILLVKISKFKLLYLNKIYVLFECILLNLISLFSCDNGFVSMIWLGDIYRS